MSQGNHTVELTTEQMQMMQHAVRTYSEQFESGTLYIRSRCGFCGKVTEWDSLHGEDRKSKHHDYCQRDKVLEKFKVD